MGGRKFEGKEGRNARLRKGGKEKVEGTLGGVRAGKVGGKGGRKAGFKRGGKERGSNE